MDAYALEAQEKMSKSSENPKGIIFLLDDLEVTRKKIMSAVTDSDNKVIYDEENKPGISNLLMIYSSMTNMSIKEAEEKFKDYNYGNFKKEVADSVINVIKPIQDKYNEIINSNLIDELLDEGKKKTNEIAKEKYEIVRKKVGLGR